MRAMASGVGILVLLSLSGASAALVTRQFEFSSTSGPLMFGPTIGSLTYDDSIARANGGSVRRMGLLKDLDMTFGGFSFDEATANTGWLTFDTAGELTHAVFGNECISGECSVGHGSEEWFLDVGRPGEAPQGFTYSFGYSGFKGATEYYETVGNRLLPIEVPEPGPIGLLALALATLLIGRGRRPRVAEL